jgi:hypothetical protein
MTRRPPLLPVLLLAGVTSAHAADGPSNPPMNVAYFSELQEAQPITPEALAERLKGRPDNDEAAAAETSLNDWKLCVLDSLARWSTLSEGPGTLIDGAYGRCSDLQRQYRTHLTKVTQNGRSTIDLNFARAMIRTLEDVWRPRLVAVVLDRMVEQKDPRKEVREPSRESHSAR